MLKKPETSGLVSWWYLWGRQSPDLIIYIYILYIYIYILVMFLAKSSVCWLSSPFLRFASSWCFCYLADQTASCDDPYILLCTAWAILDTPQKNMSSWSPSTFDYQVVAKFWSMNYPSPVCLHLSLTVRTHVFSVGETLILMASRPNPSRRSQSDSILMVVC